jgi:hypothetical protein
VFLLASLVAVPVFASPDGDAVAKCIVDNTTGKDRKDLARWVFVAMSAHPEMQSISNIAPGAIDDVSRTAGSLFTKLLTESCPAETRAALRSDGPLAIQAAFRLLGELAMQELMTDKNVAAAMSAFDNYIDKDKLAALGR